ncbi:HD domain-containing protein [Desulfonatronospira sp.]|uniref:HD domain-containing protein n=1 Tax=Desulfonatronospira sp. TaxID=1962951 RepID=UPI0025B97E98|nr:HD domain-containing protein [Desulfonatronospira sp.]
MNKRLKYYQNYFNEYVQKFVDFAPDEDANFRLKQEHCLRVMEIARNLALYQGFDSRSSTLSTLAGLFHDLGRFEQYRQYQTFNDRLSVNHALLSTRILHRENVLRELPLPDKKCILKAVLFHNRRFLPSGFTGWCLKVAGAVRDADKLDIFPIILFHITRDSRNSNTVTLDLEEGSDITPAILDQVKSGQLADYYSMRYKNDFLLLLISWVYDLNYPYSCLQVLEKGYINTIFEMLPHSESLRSLESEITLYLQHRASKGL